MAWTIGIDEAGYGPNLGPLVMSSVAWRVPERLLGADLWNVLRAAVRRQADADRPERLVVDDSKQVHGTNGIRSLESNTVPAVAPWLTGAKARLSELAGQLCPACCPALGQECWYTGETPLPVEAGDELGRQAEQLQEACAREEIVCGPVRSVAVCAPRFNALVEEWNSKGAVLAEGFTELLRTALAELEGDDPVHVFVDKHGGRNTYAAMLQHAVEEGMVIVRQEGPLCSSYQVVGLRRDLFVTFQPRADSEHFGVALASMTSKYLRELFMLEFNRFWQTHIPGLAPTAGYPNDAARFLAAIRPTLSKLGLAELAIWRQR